MKSVHSGRLERWVGADRLAQLSQSMLGWYGPPIHLLDVPGSVRVCGDGDFVGPFEHGYFASAQDSLRDIWRRAGRARHGQLNVGFTGIADALARAQYQQKIPVAKNSTTGTAGATYSNWTNGGNPGQGAVGGAAPGGTVHVQSDTGALPFANPASGTTRLTGADMYSINAANTILLYDRLFSVTKTMSSTGTESVTGVPTRYQSATATAEDYAGGNFGFIECTTTLANTAHNWTVCTYLDEGGNAGTLPSVTGNAACPALRFDHPTVRWFCPLAADDIGISAWTQMQCDASITGAISFGIGHPIGAMAIRDPAVMVPFEWLTNRNQAPRVYDNACLAFLNMSINSTGTSVCGAIELTNCP